MPRYNKGSWITNSPLRETACRPNTKLSSQGQAFLNVALAAARPGFLALAPTARFIPMRQGPGLRESAAFSFYKPISFFSNDFLESSKIQMMDFVLLL